MSFAGFILNYPARGAALRRTGFRVTALYMLPSWDVVTWGASRTPLSATHMWTWWEGWHAVWAGAWAPGFCPMSLWCLFRASVAVIVLGVLGQRGV